MKLTNDAYKQATIYELENDLEFQNDIIELFESVKDDITSTTKLLKQYKNGNSHSERYVFVKLQDLYISNNAELNTLFHNVITLKSVQECLSYCLKVKIQGFRGEDLKDFIYSDITSFFQAILQRIYLYSHLEFSDTSITQNFDVFIHQNSNYFNMFFANIWLPQIPLILQSTDQPGVNQDSQELINLTTQYYNAFASLIEIYLFSEDKNTLKITKSRLKNLCNGKLSPEEALYSANSPMS